MNIKLDARGIDVDLTGDQLRAIDKISQKLCELDSNFKNEVLFMMKDDGSCVISFVRHTDVWVEDMYNSLLITPEIFNIFNGFKSVLQATGFKYVEESFLIYSNITKR